MAVSMMNDLRGESRLLHCTVQSLNGAEQDSNLKELYLHRT